MVKGGGFNKSCEQLEHKNDDRTQNVNRKEKKLWKNSNYINTTPVLGSWNILK